MIMIYSGTVILSSTLKTINDIKKIKVLADAGFKIKDYNIKKELLINLIPFYNVIYTFKKITTKNDCFDNNIDYIKNNLIPFTIEEKNIYENNKSSFTALNLNINNHAKPNMILIFMKDNKENIIYYTIENNKTIITSCLGPISKSSAFEQYNCLENELSTFSLNSDSNNNLNPEKEKHNQKEYIRNYFPVDNYDKPKVYTKKMYID